MSAAFCCPLCASTTHSLLHRTRGGWTSFNRRAASFELCHGCGLVMRWPLPSAVETLHNFYAVEYWQNAPPAVFAPTQAQTQRWEALQHLSGAPWPAGAIVDVGCGSGHFTALLAQHLTDRQVIGLEPSTVLAERLQNWHSANNIQIVAGSLENFRSTGTISAFFLLTVFEHLLDARAALQKMHALLATEGWLVIETPDVLEPGRFGLDYFFRDFHLFYYSEHTLTLLLRQCGFEIHKVQRGGAFRTASGPTLCVTARKVADPLSTAAQPAEAERVRRHIETYGKKHRIRGPLRVFYNYKLRLPLLRLKGKLRHWRNQPVSKLPLSQLAQ